MGVKIGGRFVRLPRELTLLSLLVLGPLLPLEASAAIIDVPADQPTVRAAVNAAANGDTILIGPGTRSGGVFIANKSVTIASHYLVTGDTAMVAQTVLSGVASGMCSGASGCLGNAVLEFGTNAHGSSVIGLTLMNGENGIGANSIVSVDHCRMVANGDGVDYFAGAGGTISNSVFENNTDDGIDLNGRMNMSIHDNIIRNNNDDGIEFRLYAFSGPAVTVDIVGNSITGNGEDGIQIIDYPEVSGYVIRIDHNVFTGNFDASGSSAAIGVMPNGETVENLVGAPAAERVYVTNNTIMGEKNGLVGGANVIALNNIFVNIEGKALRRVGGNSIASYSMFWNNGVNYETSVIDAPHILLANPALGPTGNLPAGSPAIDAGTASFQWLGEAVLSIPGSEYAGTAPDIGAVEFGMSPPGTNVAPSVNAGTDQSVLFPAPAALVGSASDDGRPDPLSLLTINWSVVSGAGPMAIEDATQAATWAYFSTPGIYLLRLTANDGLITSADTVRISVLTGPNSPPVVDAGPNRTITLPASTTVDGTVSDDGLPNPPGTLTTTWSVGSGPGGVTFANANAVDTQASFTLAGTYILRLIANDGALSTTDSMQVTVLAPPPPPPIERRIAVASDDAEEAAGGGISGNVTDIELVYSTTNQTVGLRFSNVTVPPGTIITAAWIQFEADEVQSEATNLTLKGQAADNAATFTTTAGNISSRPRTTASASWTPAPWNTVGEAGPNQRTSELKTVIQEIVNRPGWASGNALAIIITGTGHRTARSFEGLAAGAALLHIETEGAPPPNAAPVVDAGPNRTITLPADAVLDGTVSDDGLPVPPGALTTTWSVGSGPGPVEFGNPNLVDTPVTFTVPGSYILRLTANDGALSTTDSMQFTVQLPANTPPAVAAGPNRTITLPASASLDGTVSDDGLPDPPAAVTTTWSKGSGPGGVTFVNANAVDTQASFTVAGTYILRLTANDGALSSIDSMQVTVLPPPPPIERRIAVGTDDGEEPATTFPNLSSADIELVFDTSLQTVGLRFTNISVPQGATINSAWIQFEADEAQSEVTNLTLKGQAADNAATFASGSGNISGRPRTTASASWSPGPWNTVGEAGADQRTSELKTVLQEIVNRPGWASGNAIAIIITGTGHRTARAFEGLAAGAALLHIEAGGVAPPNSAPTVDAGPNRAITLPASASLDGTMSDDGLPNPPGAVTTTWTVGSGPGGVTFTNANAVDTQASFTMAGTYILRLTANDGALSTTDSMQVTVSPVPNVAPVVDAGPNRAITLPASASLDGTMSDDGLPNPPGAVTTTWTVGSGPGGVTFTNANAVDTQASFTMAGTYILRLTANDGALSTTDSMQVTVSPDPNIAPVVNAGPDQTIVLPASAALNGTVSDDGLPTPPALTTTWTVDSGPGPVTFQNANLVDTQASFTTAGIYVLRLTADDSRLSTFDQVQITVQAVAAPLERRVVASSDDAEESASGVMNLNSTNLDLVFNGSNQTVGLRFTSLAIPAGANITRAYIQFTARKVDHGASSLTLRGQTADNPGTFANTAGNLGGRSRTTAAVSWAPPDWGKIGDALAEQQTPELMTIVQEIVSRPGWSSGNALVIIIMGTGARTASAYDASAADAALLHVEYATAGAPLLARRTAPVVHSEAEAPRFDFALHRAGPNPARGELWVDFSLADAGPASLELVDIAGRRVAVREVGSFGPGRHRIELREPLPTGVYLVRLAQGRSARVMKIAVLK